MSTHKITKNTITSGNSGKIAAGQYLKKGGKVKTKKYADGGPIMQKRKETDEEGNSITTRVIKNPITKIKTKATIRRSADGDKAKSTVKESYKKGGMVKKQDGGTSQTKSQRLVNKSFDLYDKADSKGYNMAYDRRANAHADEDNLPTNSKKTQRIVKRADRIYDRAMKAKRNERAAGVYKKGGLVKKQGGGAAIGVPVGGDPNSKVYRKKQREIKKFDKHLKREGNVSPTPVKKKGGMTKSKK